MSESPLPCVIVDRYLTSVDSDVVYLNLLGADHIILNSNEAISDLLDKRSALYSDRVRASRIHHTSAS